jgi:hypothetical protein
MTTNASPREETDARSSRWGDVGDVRGTRDIRYPNCSNPRVR